MKDEDEKKAKEIARKWYHDNAPDTAYRAAIQMAAWKDEQQIKRDELILSWFNHIEQDARDRKTANGKVMNFQDCLDEIKVFAKEAQEYLRNN